MSNNYKRVMPINRYTDKFKPDRLIHMTSGRSVLMCPKCRHMETIYCTTSSCINHESITGLTFDINYFGICKSCGEHVAFEELDINIAPIIKILNDKGYYTAYSCEGHIETSMYDGIEEVAGTYIYFLLNYQKIILEEYPLPTLWEVDNGVSFCIRDVIMNELPNGEDVSINEVIQYAYKNWNRKQSLVDIYNWANSLPDWSTYPKRSLAIARTALEYPMLPFALLTELDTMPYDKLIKKYKDTMVCLYAGIFDDQFDPGDPSNFDDEIWEE